MTSRRFAIAAAVVIVIALAGVVTFAVSRSGPSGRSSREPTSTPTTTVPATPLTTLAPQTISVPPLPPAGPTTAPPPAITVPRGAGGTAPPASTTAPTVTAAPITTGTSPSTTKPTTSTTKPTSSTTKPATSTTKLGKFTRKTLVYSPAGAPKRGGDLVLPRTHTSTIVVLAHAGSDVDGRKQMRGWADFYAQHGYATFAVEYFVPKPSTSSPVYPKPETDVKAAVQFLRERAGAFAIDPDGIVVQGFSTGAALGAQAEVTPNDPFFNGSGHYPNISDAPAAFIGFSGLYDGTQRDPTRYYGGPPDSVDPKVKERYAEADLIAQAAGAVGPALLYAAEDADPALLQSATSFRDALQSAGKDVTLTLMSGAGAGPTFDQEKSGTLTPAGKQAAQQVLEWLEVRFPPE